MWRTGCRLVLSFIVEKTDAKEKSYSCCTIEPHPEKGEEVTKDVPAVDKTHADPTVVQGSKMLPGMMSVAQKAGQQSETMMMGRPGMMSQGMKGG